MKRLFVILAAAAMICACGTPEQTFTKGSQYAKMYEEQPVSILVMPPINNTSSVEAKELLYTSISRPLAEEGYYVISPLLAMDILKTESAYDAELFREGSLVQFKKFFGADAVLFTEINNWSKIGFGIETDIHMFIRSTTTGETLFERNCELYLDLSTKTSGSSSTLSTLLALASSVVKTAVTEPIEAARMANTFILSDIPAGKYSDLYGQDQDLTAAAKDISTTVHR